jgi:hypothetical protein
VSYCLTDTKMKSESKNVVTEVLAQYDNKNVDIFPTRLHIESVTQGKRNICRDFVFSKVSFTEPTQERFSIKSMNLPLNTMISDVRINRVISYWNGFVPLSCLIFSRSPRT